MNTQHTISVNTSLRRIGTLIIILFGVLFIAILLSVATSIMYFSKIQELEDTIITLQKNMITEEHVTNIVNDKIDHMAINVEDVEEPVSEEYTEAEELAVIEKQIINDVVVFEGAVSTTDVLSTDQFHKETFVNTLNQIAPELSGIEDAIFSNYEQYGLSPMFQLAVFCLESGYGTSSLSKNKNNLCGFKAYPTATKSSYENATTFETKSDCVLAFGDTIYNGYIVKGLITVQDISKIYCPPNSAHWNESVTSLKEKIHSTYNELLGV